MKAHEYLLLLVASIAVVAVLTDVSRPQERPEPPVVVEPVVVEKTQSLVPRSSDRGLTPEARELWYRCVDLWEACDFSGERQPDGYLDKGSCEEKLRHCENLVNEANR